MMKLVSEGIVQKGTGAKAVFKTEGSPTQGQSQSVCMPSQA